MLASDTFDTSGPPISTDDIQPPPPSITMPAATAATPAATTTTTAQPGPNMAPWLTAFGGLTSAFSQFKAGETNASIARFNANLERLRSNQAIQSGDLAAAQESARQKQREGALTASLGAQGVGPAGTAAAAAASSRNMSAMDQLVIKVNARRQAAGFEARAASDEIQADQEARQGKTTALATLLYTGAQEELETDPSYKGFRYGGVNLGGGR